MVINPSENCWHVHWFPMRLRMILAKHRVIAEPVLTPTRYKLVWSQSKLVYYLFHLYRELYYISIYWEQVKPIYRNDILIGSHSVDEVSLNSPGAILPAFSMPALWISVSLTFNFFLLVFYRFNFVSDLFF